MQKKIKNMISFSKKLKVLYVEDNDAARKSTHTMLYELFGDIILAKDGEDGFSKFKENNVNLIITDLNMPKLNGIEMIAKIRELDNKIPILILTAYNESDYFIETIKHGIDGYLLKPIIFNQFLDVILKIIEFLKLEEENKNYRESLEEMVLAQTQKIETQKKELEKSLEIKTKFLSNMTHEMKTPLHHIMGFSELFNQTQITKKQKTYIDSIIFGANTLLGFANNILDGSKLQSGNLKLNKNYHNSYELFTDIKNFFALSTAEKNLKFKIKFIGDIANFIKIDVTRVKQIMINLIENAIKFTHKGYIYVDVETRKNRAKRIDLIVTVKDSGIGIEKNSYEKIFKQFEKQTGQCESTYKGCGLGLYISKDLANMMNGDIKVESQESVGSSFELILKDIEYY